MMYCFVPRTLQFEASNSVCVHNNDIIHYRVAEVEESANPFPLAGLVFPLGELLRKMKRTCWAMVGMDLFTEVY